jgi:hypothetical protein
MDKFSKTSKISKSLGNTFREVRAAQKTHVSKEGRLGIRHHHPPNTTLACVFVK